MIAKGLPPQRLCAPTGRRARRPRDMGRYGEIWGDMGRYGEIYRQQNEHAAPPRDGTRVLGPAHARRLRDRKQGGDLVPQRPPLARAVRRAAHAERRDEAHQRAARRGQVVTCWLIDESSLRSRGRETAAKAVAKGELWPLGVAKVVV